MEKYEVSYRAPSNIALVKYWGKKKVQIPMNPNLSFSLSSCHTTTTATFQKGNGEIRCWVDGLENLKFLPKIKAFVERIQADFPEVSQYSISIKTKNTFPHGSGIASSASGFAALALCFADFYNQLYNQTMSKEFWQRASVWARLGSGSASRSIYGGFVRWGVGEEGNPESFSNQYATPIPKTMIHPDFLEIQDTILLVENTEKSVSSSDGHALIDNHFFKEGRITQAKKHFTDCLSALRQGNQNLLTEIIESEALSLHALMQSSKPYFILIKPNTLHIIQKIWQWRRQKKIWIVFTLDAGANVHLLHLHKDKEAVENFVKTVLSGFCKNGAYLRDRIGLGPIKLA